MNLVYIWFEQCRKFKNQGIKLNNNYEITILDNLSFEIKKNNKPSLYRENNILDSYIILGKNGTGKSTLLQCIGFEDFSPAAGPEGKYFMIFEQEEKYYVLFTYYWDESVSCCINGKQYKKLDDNTGLVGEGVKFENKESDFIIGGIQNIEGMFCYHTLNYENHIHFYENALNSNVLKFIVHEKEFLGLKKDFTFYLKINYPDSIKLELKNYIDISELDDIDIRENSSFESVIKYLFLKFYWAMISLNYLYERVDNSLNIENVFKQLYDIESVDEIFTYGKLVLNKIKMIENHYDYYERYVTFIENLIKLKNEIKISYDSIEIVLDNINDENFNFYYSMFKASDFMYPEFENMFSVVVNSSCGENSYINILACLYTIIEKVNNEMKKNICYLFLDEIEQNLHPEWSRKLYNKIVQLINKNSINHKYNIYLSTHSPYVVSDFTSDHIINLDDSDNKSDFQTFGSNIHDILSKGMFLDNPMGEYAYNMIRKVHKALSSDKSKEDILKASGMDSEAKLKYFIDSIGEPLIKMQLKQLWDNLEKEWNKDTNNVNDELYNLISSLNDKEKVKLIKELKGEVDVKD